MAYPISRFWIVLLFKHLVKHVRGFDNLPDKGSFIIAANHISYFDAFCIWAILFPKYKQKMYFISRPIRTDNKLLNKLIQKWSGCIPVDYDEPSACLKPALELAKNNNIVGFFPEGMRIPAGNAMLRAKTGVIRLALKSKRPVLPIGIIAEGEPHVVTTKFPYKKAYKKFIQKKQIFMTNDSIISPDRQHKYELDPKEYDAVAKHVQSRFRHSFKHFYSKGHRFTIILGQPISYEQYYDTPITHALLRKLTTELMQTISKLSGREYPYTN